MALCAKNDGKPTVGKSKYCTEHRAESRANWKANIAASNDARVEREAAHLDLFTRAYAAGKEAGDAVTPAVMVVERHANQFDDSSPVVQRWVEPAGVCGFAWVMVRPGNSSFARWLVKTGRGRSSSYQGGVMVSTAGEYGQSLENKQAFAAAFAAVLRDAGIKAYSQSRMD